MAKLVTLKRQSGEAVYPVTVTAAVMDSNGNPAEVVFAKKQDSVSSKSSDQGVEVELSGTLASPTVKVNVTSSGITSDNNSVAIASDVFKYAAKNEVFKGAKAATSSSVAEAGKVGLVPAPASGATTKYLRSDGNWSDITTLSGLTVQDLRSFIFNDRVYLNGQNVLRTILKGTDIDTLFGEGNCGFWRSIDNETYENSPVTNFGLMVNRINGTYFSQMIFGYSGGHLFYRSQVLKDEGVIWSAWKKIPFFSDTIKTTYDTDKGVKVELSGTFDEPKIDVTTTFGDVAISNSSNAVSGKTIAKSVPLLVGKNGTEIPANSDLNSPDFCENAGTYLARTNDIATSLTNSPTRRSFIMVVESHAQAYSLSSAYSKRIRKITDIIGCEWIQELSSDGDKVVQYQPWYRIIREDTTFTKATTSTANGTQVVNAGTGGAVPAPQTLADNDKFLKGNGTWSAIPTSSVGSGITLPATGNAVHEALTGTTYINTIGTDFIDNLFTAKG